jgi:DNA-directed RNA polymerase specialized sigma subunit
MATDRGIEMNHEQPRTPSNVELAQIVLRQQCQIEKLSETVARLEAQMAQIEARLDRLDLVGQPSTAQVEAEREREQAIRDALRHLDDVAYLAESRLAQLVAQLHGQPPSGHSLRSALSRAIQRMKPAEGQPRQTREHRCYHILRLTYVERKKAAEVAKALAISERQYYRELKAAIHKVADRILGPWL